MSRSPAIRAEGLGKTFERRVREPGVLGALKALVRARHVDVHAVRDLSFTVRRGESVGLIGENGAGKSTTIKMLTGILVPTGGTLEVLGRVPWRERSALALNIGVVFGQRPQLLWDIPVRETFDLLKTMYAIPERVYRVTWRESVRRLALEPLLRVPVRQLSLGQRMRCDLAASLLHAPAIAFLDEPTIGLDATAKEQARELIRLIRREFGTTVILTTHDLKDITELSRRLLVLDKGRLLFDGTLAEFERRWAPDQRLIADLSSRVDGGTRARLAADLKRIGAVARAWEPYRVTIEYQGDGLAPRILQAVMRRAHVSDFTLERTDIETIVRRIYARARDGNAS